MPRLQATPAEIQKYLALLEGTPRQISACVGSIEDAKLAAPSGKKEWSPVEILGHLRACSDLWTYSIYAMLTQDNPTLPLLDERRWAKTRSYAELSFSTSFQSFALSRAELMVVLRDLPEASWAKTATIEGRTHSVFSQARRMALHEAEHCEQIKLFLNPNE